VAIAEVASRRASAFANLVDYLDCADPGTVTAGELLVCGGWVYPGGGVLPASVGVTDTRGTSYTVLSCTNGVERGWIAFGIAPSSGGNTIRVNPSTASDYISFSIDAFTVGPGQTIALSVDGSGSIGSGINATPADSITTLTADELIIGLMGYDGATTTIAPGGSWTEIGEHEDNSSDEAHALEFGIVTTAQAYSVDWTLGTGRDWKVMTASFKEIAAPATGVQPVIVIVT
jgi:hypothetical protein